MNNSGSIGSGSNVGQVRDSLNRSTQFTYDAKGNLTSFKAPGGSNSSYRYDDRGNLISLIDSQGQEISFTYDAVFNRLLSVQDARGNTTRYSYDDRGNLQATTYPNGSAEKFSYDSTGNLLRSVNRRDAGIHVLPLQAVTSITALERRINGVPFAGRAFRQIGFDILIRLDDFSCLLVCNASV